MTNKILKLPDVIKMTGRSRSSIYADIKENNFPAPINLGLRAVGWVERDINEWIEERINLSRQQEV